MEKSVNYKSIANFWSVDTRQDLYMGQLVGPLMAATSLHDGKHGRSTSTGENLLKRGSIDQLQETSWRRLWRSWRRLWNHIWTTICRGR